MNVKVYTAIIRNVKKNVNKLGCLLMINHVYDVRMVQLSVYYDLLVYVFLVLRREPFFGNLISALLSMRIVFRFFCDALCALGKIDLLRGSSSLVESRNRKYLPAFDYN